jgi:hypothetical protein
MPSFVMLTRLSHGSLRSPAALEELERQVMDRIRAECMKVATIIRTFGHAQTEIWPATKWSAYKQMVRDLPAGEAA